MARITIINGAIGTGKSTVAQALKSETGGSIIEGQEDCALVLARVLQHSGKNDRFIVVDNRGVLHAALLIFDRHVVYQIHCSH